MSKQKAVATQDGIDGVSIIIPTYNRHEMLRECVASLLAQTIPPLEIIVVDDGSMDGTAATVGSIEGPIRYIAQKNAGKSSAANLGLSVAQGNFIWFFDDDDWAEPNAIEIRISRLLNDQSLGFVGGAHFMGRADERGQRLVDYLRKLPKYPEEQRKIRLFEDCYFSLCSVLARRSCYETIGGFDTDLKSSEDYDVLLRLASKFRFDVLDEPVFTVRRHGGIRGSGNFTYKAEKRREIFRRTDREIGLKLRAALSLGDFDFLQAKGTAAEPDDAHLYMERAVVMASKGLISEMFDDLGSVAQSKGGISPKQNQRILDAVFCDYAFDAIWDSRHYFKERWAALQSSGRAGAAIADQLKYAIWRLARTRGIGWQERLQKMAVFFDLLWR